MRTLEPTVITDTENIVISELRSVLEKHGKLERFGVAVLHEHFELKEGEILLEKTDHLKRESVSKPELIEDPRSKGFIPTIIELKDGKVMQWCSPCSH